MEFRGRVLQPSGEIEDVRVLALDRPAAVEQLTRGGRTVLRLRRSDWQAQLRLSAGHRFDTVLFTEELITLLDAGLTIGESLETLRLGQVRNDARHQIERMLTLLRQGQPFSMALAAQGRTFSTLYCAMVRSSEHTGHLSEALRRYLSYHHQMSALRRQVLGAATYPLLLMAVGTLVIAFLLSYVVPRFGAVYRNAGRLPPWSTRVLLAIGNTFAHHGGSLAIALAAVGMLIAAAWNHPRGRSLVLRILWRMPGVYEPLKAFQLARLFRSMGMLVEGGIPLVQSLDMTAPLLGGPLHAGIAKVREALQHGQPVAKAFALGGLTTPVAERLLIVGERSGQMASMLHSIARFLDEATARRLAWITQLFEPLLMIVIGLTVGLIVVLLYMPIFDLTGVFQ